MSQNSTETSRAIALACLTIASSASWAADVEEIFVTASRAPQTMQSIVGNAFALDNDTLSATAHQHIQQALIKVPGVSMHRNDGMEYLPAIRSPVLSGAGACGSYLMAEDGIPLRPAGFCNVNELFEAHTEQASRIEVIRGPANVMYGSNAMHGVINVMTPDVGDDMASLSVEAGPNAYKRLKLSVGNEQHLLAVTGLTSDSFRDDSGVDQQKLTYKNRFAVDDLVITSALTAVNLNQETAGYISGTDAYKDKALAATNPNPEAYRDARAVRLWSRVEKQTDSHSWIVTPYVRYSKMDFLQHFLPGTPLEQNGQSSVGVQSLYKTQAANYTLSMGLDAEVTDGWLKQTQENPTVGSAFLVGTIPQGKQYDYEVQATQIAPFVQVDWTPSDATSLSAGVRYERMSYDYDNLMVDGRTREDGTTCGFGGCRYTRPADSSDDFSNWSPFVGALFNVSPQVQLFANLAEGFRAPQAVELYRLQRAQEIADLDSEKLRSLEVGSRGGFDKLSYELTLYSMQKDNVIFRDSDFFNVSNGKTSHKGIEMALRYQINPQWDVSWAGSLARHQYENSDLSSDIEITGNDVDTAPKQFGVVDLGWQPTAGSRYTLEWVYMGAYFTDPENLHRYDGHEVLNLRAHWAINDQLKLSARLLNAMDTRYAERADYTSFGGDRYFPGAPRSLYVSLDVAW